MKKIYIIATNTGIYFSKVLRFVTREKYVHVSIALDEKFNKVYSFGRKKINWILPAGFVEEDLNKITAIFKDSISQVYELNITNKQYYNLKKIIKKDFIRESFKYKYNIRGLPMIQFNKVYQRKYHYVCSQFCGKLLSDADIYDFKKDYSLIKPKDIFTMKGLKLIYEGKTIDFINKL